MKEKANICVIRVLEGEKKGGGAKKVLKEIMMKRSPNLGKDINIQIQKLTEPQMG